MATFYIQLEDRLQKISGDLTYDNIVMVLGYTPSNFSGNFNDLIDNPLTQDDNGELKIVDENGNIIAIVDSEGIHSIDFVAGDHKLSDKADKSEIPSLDGYATEQWVEDKNYLTEHQDISHLATKEEVADVDFFDIKNNPITNAEEGNLIFVDESGNIGLKLDKDNNLTVKDVIAGDNILSNKVDKESGKGLSTEDFTTALKNKLQSLSNYDDASITEAVNSLRADFDTLVSGDTSTAIKTFNEIIAFLEGVEDTESLSGIIASIEQQIANIEIPSLDGYATEDYVNQKEQAIQTWVNNKAFATQEDVANIDFYEIKDNPIVNDGDGKLIFADENGNIGLQLEADNTLYVKDVIAGDNILSNKADKSDLEGLATESYVVTKIAEAKLEGSDVVIPVQDVKVNGQTVIKDMVADIDLTPYAKSEDVPSIEGLATEQWVTDKNYLTQHQDISHLAEKSELPTKTSDLTNDSGFITINDVPEVTVPTKTSELTNDSGFITIEDVPVLEIPDEYVTETELNDKGYLTEHQDISHLATKEEIPSLDGYATTLEVSNKVDKVEGKGLSSEDFTTEIKGKVQVLNVIAEDVDGELEEVPEDVYVKYVIQSLTEEQKSQVRNNINATSPNDFKTFNGESIVGSGNIETKKEISILFVGNSLTQDGIAYLPYMLKTYYPDINFRIYMWYIGGKTLENQYSYFTTNGVADIFSVAENTSYWTNYSKNKTMSWVLENYTFDIVCMQEYFNYKTEYKEVTDWNNCRDFIISNYKGGNALEFISLFHAPLRKDGADVNEVYKRTEEGNALILQTTISQDIIPNGIAVYRALGTILNSLGDKGQLSPDGTHTQEGLPCLLQTYTTLCWLFDRLGINKSIYGHPMRMTTEIYNSIKVPGANLGSGVIQGTDAENILAQEIAIKAYKEGKQFLMRNLYPFEWGSSVKPLNEYTFSIVSDPIDAIIKLNGVEQSSVTVVEGSIVNWEVSKENYYTQSGSETVTSNIVKDITLQMIKQLDSISVEFTQGNVTIFNEQNIEDLRNYITVTANYNDGTFNEVQSYTLSGNLDNENSEIIVTFAGKTDTFNVNVTNIALPTGYTRYGYIESIHYDTVSKSDYKHPDNFIYLNAYDDMNTLSSEFTLGCKPGVKLSTPGVCGARLASGSSTPWYGLYLKEDGVSVQLRNTTQVVPWPSDTSKFKVTIDNKETSPYRAKINNGSYVSKEWTAPTSVIPYGMSLFNNIPNGSTSNMSFNIQIRIGEIVLRKYDGECVGYYIPAVYENKIGMYDVMTQTFCTAKIANAVTLGDSDCLYNVGNFLLDETL